MKNNRQLGIWMDHANAILMELLDNSITQSTIKSEFTYEEKEDSLRKSEKLMHNKEQQEQSAYYKELGETIKNFDEVLLFGPTNAKDELYNLLKDNQKFISIKIEVKQGDKMTDNQMHAFVKKYYN